MEEEKKLTEPTTPSPAGHKRRRGTRKHKGRGNRGKASAALHTPDGSPAAEPAPEAPQVPEEPKTALPQTDAPPQDQETSAPPANEQNTAEYVVQSGDTLWDIASEYTNGDQQSIRGYVGELMKINNLATDQIQEGQHLTVVYYGN